MSSSAKKLIDEALRLPEEERAEVISELLHSLHSPNADDSRSDKDWIDEVELRARAALAGSPGVSWEQARTQVAKRLRNR